MTDTDASAITLRYTSTRDEVSHWYWRMWRKKLWMYHAFFVLMVFVYVFASDGHWPPRPLTYVYGLFGACGVLGFFIGFPQLMFKPQERTLTVSKAGIQTTIGKKSGSVSWSKIGRIEETPELIYIVRSNQNAFLVPQRAFQAENERANFLSSIRTWQSQAEPARRAAWWATLGWVAISIVISIVARILFTHFAK